MVSILCLWQDSVRRVTQVMKSSEVSGSNRASGYFVRVTWTVDVIITWLPCDQKVLSEYSMDRVDRGVTHIVGGTGWTRCEISLGHSTLKTCNLFILEFRSQIFRLLEQGLKLWKEMLGHGHHSAGLCLQRMTHGSLCS